ncbi:MAG: hypothetical protein IJY16_08100, partial [Clostridia bacterium]|nr:hypothetical protein [Clostridia bacterium]
APYGEKIYSGFCWPLPQPSTYFARQRTAKDAEIFRRKACAFDSLTAKHYFYFFMQTPCIFAGTVV